MASEKNGKVVRKDPPLVVRIEKKFTLHINIPYYIIIQGLKFLELIASERIRLHTHTHRCLAPLNPALSSEMSAGQLTESIIQINPLKKNLTHTCCYRPLRSYYCAAVNEAYLNEKTHVVFLDLNLPLF